MARHWTFGQRGEIKPQSRLVPLLVDRKNTPPHVPAKIFVGRSLKGSDISIRGEARIDRVQFVSFFLSMNIPELRVLR